MVLRDRVGACKQLLEVCKGEIGSHPTQSRLCGLNELIMIGRERVRVNIRMWDKEPGVIDTVYWDHTSVWVKKVEQ